MHRKRKKDEKVLPNKRNMFKYLKIKSLINI